MFKNVNQKPLLFKNGRLRVHLDVAELAGYLQRRNAICVQRIDDAWTVGGKQLLSRRE